MTTINVTCISCGGQHEFQVRDEDMRRYESGELIQREFPYLSAGQRELMISQTCETCFEEMFPEEDD